MAEIDKDLIRAQVAGLLGRVSEPLVFDAGLHDLLRSLGSEEQAAGARQFIPGMGESYGVPLPALRVIAAELVKWGQRRPAEAFALVERLWHNGSRDERVVAAKMLERLGKREPERTLELAASLPVGRYGWQSRERWSDKADDLVPGGANRISPFAHDFAKITFCGIISLCRAPVTCSARFCCDNNGRSHLDAWMRRLSLWMTEYHQHDHSV